MVSRTGDAVYFVAATWLVFDLTGSTFFTGLTVALSRLPAVGSVFLGPLVDRSPIGRLLPAVEVVQAVVVVLVPLAALFDRLSVLLVLGVVTTLATLQRVSAPAAQAALPRLVDEDRLAQANSVYTSTRQALGALAESAAGSLIALVGAAALFAVDAATFAVGAVVYAALRVPAADDAPDAGAANDGAQTDEQPANDGAQTDEQPANDGAQTDEQPANDGERVDEQPPNDDEQPDERSIPTLATYLTDIREGVATIRGSFLRHAVGGAMLASVGTGLSVAVLPAFGDAVGGARAYGLLVAATTASTLLGSLVAARFEDRPFGLVVVCGFLLAAVGRLAAVVFQTPLFVFVAFGAAAVPLGVYNVLVSTVLQVGVPNRLMARVSSTNGTLLAVVGSLGLLLGGALGTRLDAATVVGLSAGGYLALAAYWLAVPTLRSFPAVSTVEPGAFDPGK